MVQPIDENVEKVMNEIADVLDSSFNPHGYGFVLLSFPFGHRPGNMNYISNSNREDMLKALKEFISNAEEDIN